MKISEIRRTMVEKGIPTEIVRSEQLKKVSAETMRFLRGKYAFDEAGNDKDEVAFCDGNQRVLTIYIRDGYYDFHIGENALKVSDMESLEKAKQMILAQKEPNRKPFPKENAIYGGCGHRCDLCVHYTGETVSEEFREEMRERVRRVYGMKPDEEFKPCNGCANGGITGKFDCDQMKCAKEKGVPCCMDCPKYDCGSASVGWKPAIEPRSVSADDVTWAILPYVDGQYGN
jgi:hypothetical protein